MATAEYNLIDQKERRLAAEGLAHSYCVEASAGTGKTTLLIDRLLAIVRQGAAELKNVAAITFTEKAANEIKVRLREELEKKRPQDPGEVRDRFDRALEQLESARISTIHAFAASLLRERPVEAGIDPGFEQLDAMGSQLLFDEVWERWKRRQLSEPPAVVQRLLALDFSLDKKIKPIAEKLLANRDIVFARAKEDTSPPDIEAIWRSVEQKMKELKVQQGFCKDADDRGYRQIEALASIIQHTPARPLDQERALVCDIKVDSNRGNQNSWRDDACRRQKTICEHLKQILEDARKSLGHNLAAETLLWLEGLLQKVEAEKQKRGALDFQDLLLKARDLVRDNPEVRRYFQSNLKFLLVDEFQDTDPLQAELVFFLAEDGAVAAKWQKAKVAPGRLFLVGDPKQSIYRFRRADIQIYGQSRAKLDESGGTLSIQQNFRSSPWLLEAVNALIGPQMSSADYQLGYKPLVAAPGRENAGPALALLFPPESYEPGNMNEYRRHEAKCIARFLLHICAPGSSVKVGDKDAGRTRTPIHGDIALLFPIIEGLEVYDEALRDAGFDVQVDGGRQFYLRRETQALVSVLRAVDHPEDTIAVVAALRSPFFGLSDEDLLLFRHAKGRFNYLGGVPDNYPRVKNCFDLLRRWHQLRATLSLPLLLDTILDDSGVLPFFLLLAGGEQQVANLLRIVELARRFEREPSASLRSFIRWLRQREAAELAEEETAFRDEQENAVHLLTIHKAKGLEFPIVVLAGMACGKNNKHDVLVDHTRKRIGFPLMKGLQTANYDELLEEDDQSQTSEDLRLFYVAVTRARDCLVIPRLLPRRQFHPRFLGFFQEQLERYGAPPKKNKDVGNGVLLVAQKDLPEVPDDSTQHPLPRNLGAAPPDESLVKPILEGRVARKLELAGLGVKAEIDGSKKGWHAATPAEKSGAAFHRIMQQVRFTPEEDPLLDAIISQAAEAEGIVLHTPTLKFWVQRALRSPLLDRIRKSARIWREMPYCLAGEDQLVQEGRIDLLFEDGDGGLVLVDYKIDEVTPMDLAKAAEVHRPQLGGYREALRRLTGAYPKETIIYFAKLGVEQAIPF